MNDKIKVYLTKELKNLLLKDAKNFDFCKSDGNVNLNSFINTLIVNYYEDYKENQMQLSFLIQNILAKSCLSANEMTQLTEKITYQVQNFKHFKNSKKASAVLSFKPTRKSEAAVEYIERMLLKDHTLSSYYSGMFASYASLPQDKRELIIFKEIKDKISKAIEKKQMIIFTLNHGKDQYVAAPYMIAASPEEMHNYILTTVLSYNSINDSNPPMQSTFRLSRIEKLSIHDESYEFSEQEISVFSRALRNGVQFIYHASDEEIKVHLKDPYGIKMFERFYVHRPLPVKKEGCDYYFDCSYDQCINYFARFGSNACIEYPSVLKQRMGALHYWAAKANKYTPTNS